MPATRPQLTDPTGTKPRRVPGITLVLLGLVCFVLSQAVDGGFVKGLLIGATVALMVLGAYVVGAGTWHARRGGQELDAGRHWLPSRDDSDDRTDR